MKEEETPAHMTATKETVGKKGKKGKTRGSVGDEEGEGWGRRKM